MSRKRRRQGESGDPRKRNAADRKADRARWQDEAAHAEIVEIGDAPGMPGMVMYKVGPVLTLETRLLPGAPDWVREIYRDRIISVATGRCPRCGEIVRHLDDYDENDVSTVPTELRHDQDCPVLTLSMEWFDPRGIAMDAPGVPVSMTSRSRNANSLMEAVREQDPELYTRVEEQIEREKAAISETLKRVNKGHVPPSHGLMRAGTQLHHRLSNAFERATETGALCPHVDPRHPIPGLILDHYRYRIACADCYMASWEPLPDDQEFRCDRCMELMDLETAGQIITPVAFATAVLVLCPECFAVTKQEAGVD